jgi:phosphoribosylformylglycinamidine (FGAM) synthase-like enzyme
MLIGLGGGAASSMAAGSSRQDLDFASVQRDNAGDAAPLLRRSSTAAGAG